MQIGAASGGRGAGNAVKRHEPNAQASFFPKYAAEGTAAAIAPNRSANDKNNRPSNNCRAEFRT